MERYLIFIDLDGTLLTNDNLVSDFNKKAIEEVIKLGNEVIIVTGRSHYRSIMYYEELKLKSLFVNRNASFIHAPFDDKYSEFIQYIDLEAVNKIVNFELLEEIYLENKNNIFILKGNTEFYKKYELCKIYNIELGNIENNINLIAISVKNENVQKTKEYLDEIEIIKYEVYNQGDTSFFHIYPISSDKSNAIKYLSEYYNVPKERIIAFGDGENDVIMIKEAGIGVAMKNALDEVKSVAKVILDKTNNESGVGMFLKDFFKLNI